MTDRTPTTNQVRDFYAIAAVMVARSLGDKITASEAYFEFDRWLEAETARIGALTLKLLAETEATP